MSRAIRDRAKLEEDARSGYVVCSRKQYRNKIPDKVGYTSMHTLNLCFLILMGNIALLTGQCWSILDEFLHSDVASRQDNYRKRKVML